MNKPYRQQLNVFQFLENVSLLIQEKFKLTAGESQSFKLCVGVSLLSRHKAFAL